tara:strand:+ start:2207 stop:2803 length:597 start_codon:yes stop_codon:yes gene_type:complete
MTEEEVLKVIDKTVAYLAPSFKFGYFDIEDMKQEGFIFCLDALKSFNFKKSNQDELSNALFTFLKTHVRWRFLNMRRKQLARIEPPACSCDLCKTDSANRLDCKKYSNWVKRNMAKRSLMEPFDVDELYSKEVSGNLNFTDSLTSSEVRKILDQHIPAAIRVDYRKFIDGDSLSKNKVENLVQEIKNILNEYYFNENR